MNKFQQFMEKRLLPVSSKIAANRSMLAIRDGLACTLPLIIVGAFFLVITYLPIPNWDKTLESMLGASWEKILTAPVAVTYDIIALVAVFAIAYFKTNHNKLKGAVNVGFMALASFLILVPFEKIVTSEVIKELGDRTELITGVIPTQYVGSQGLFTAIFVALVTAGIYKFFITRKISFKMPESVPPAVAQSFASLLPIFLSILLFFIIKIIFLHTPYGSFNDFILQIIQKPISGLTSSLGGAILINLLVSCLWFFGLHGGAIVGAVVFAPLTALAVQNKDAFVAHAHHLPNIVTQQFLDNFTYIGGGGATLSLLLVLLLMRKTKGLESERSVAKFGFIPALFNINEPVIFGMPIMFNPLLIIPFIIGPIVMTLMTYFAMASNFVSPPIGTAVPWTAPPLISGYLSTFDWKAIILHIALIVVPMAIYYPFIKMQAKSNIQRDMLANDESNEKLDSKSQTTNKKEVKAK